MGESESAMAKLWLVGFVAIAFAELEQEREVEQMRETMVASPSEAAQHSYRAIGGFKMSGGATDHTGKVATREECRGMCSPDKSCKSYSWRPKDKSCVTSPKALDYDPNYDLNVKAKESRTAGKYRKFEGLIYKDTAFNKVIVGGDEESCQKACNDKSTCAAYSFSTRLKNAKQCFLSPKAIDYSEHFTYYEKKGAGAEAAENADGKKGKVAPPEKSAEEKASEDPDCKVEEIKEKAKIAEAQKEKQLAVEAIAKGKAEIATLQSAAEKRISQIEQTGANDIEATKEKAQKGLIANEKAIAAGEEAKLRNGGEKLNLQFATKELAEKAQAKSLASGELRSEADTKAASVKEKSEKAAASTLMEATTEAKIASGKQALEDDVKAVKQAQAKADELKAEADKEKAAADERSQKDKEAGLSEDEIAAKRKKELLIKAAADAAKLRQQTELKVNLIRDREQKELADKRNKGAAGLKASSDELQTKTAEAEKIREQQQEKADDADASEKEKSDKKIEAAEQATRNANQKSLKAESEAVQEKANTMVAQKADEQKAATQLTDATLQAQQQRQTQEMQEKEGEQQMAGTLAAEGRAKETAAEQSNVQSQNAAKKTATLESAKINKESAAKKAELAAKMEEDAKKTAAQRKEIEEKAKKNTVEVGGKAEANA